MTPAQLHAVLTNPYSKSRNSADGKELEAGVFAHQSGLQLQCEKQYNICKRGTLMRTSQRESQLPTVVLAS